ncbi:MAG: ATP-binding protein [Parabacteroides sp.]|nr:ATP-binding protein [Parabacteroides sp.]
MIVNFSIKNFGPIKERQTLSFEAEKSTHLEDAYVTKTGKKRLLKLALIYGPNASGKTTILKALDFLRNIVLYPVDKKTTVFNFEPFLFDAKTPEENSIISIEFINDRIKYFYEVEFMRKAIVREELTFWNPVKANLYKRTTNLSNQYTEITFGSTVKIDKTFKKTLEANTLWNNTVLGGYLKTNIDFQELKGVISWFQETLTPIIWTRTDLEDFVSEQINKNKIVKSDVIDILRKADFYISDIQIKEEEKDMPDSLYEFLLKRLEEENRKVKVSDVKKKVTTLDLKLIHSINGKDFSIPFNSESSGTRRYYGLAGLLAMSLKERMILSVDELEASLHPDLYEHFLLSFLMNSKQSQIIATTHNREILNNREIFRNDAIWFTDKNNDCATELYSLADFDSSVVRDTTNVLNAYKSGKLGATPNPVDYYIDPNS